MRRGLWLAYLAATVGCVAARPAAAQSTGPASFSLAGPAPTTRAAEPAAASPTAVAPLSLAIEDPESVYPAPSARSPEEGYNGGGVHFDLDVSFFNRYIFRGVDQTGAGAKPENSLQFNGKMEFDLGNAPHPFLGLFVNVFDHDPVSRFEEVRPFMGLAWTIKPLTITGGYTSYIFPNREKTRDTQEAFASLSLDDSRIWNTDLPILSPYIYGAYDFDRYDGTYIEAGVRHDFVIGDSGVTLTPMGSVAYIIDDRRFLAPGFTTDTGWQHYEAGVVGNYSINQGLHLARRYGDWKIKGSLFYDDGLQSRVRGDSRLWGGVGLSFSY